LIKCVRTQTPFTLRKIWKQWLLSSVIGLIGAYIVQLGDNQRRSEFTKEEVSFMNENKAYSQFTSADKDLASKITHKCTYNSDAVFEQCLPKILTWEAKIYQSYNAHRKISDSEAIKYTEEELRDKHNYWINKKR
ncbi:hypothetical protein M0L28_RS16290, partial [Proteus mirabilis]|nr:hypothetical protein [Proteus mirabilis]